MRIVMAGGVPKRREGGVAGTIYNRGSEMEELGHSATYVFLDDLIVQGSVAPRFLELVFSLRLARYIAKNRGKFSIVNLHAPAGLVYGWRRRWNRSAGDPPYVMTMHGLEEKRVHAMEREAKKGRALEFDWKNPMLHIVFHLT